jgi:predicted dehydrogenase
MAPTDDEETKAIPAGSPAFSCGAGPGPTGVMGRQFPKNGGLKYNDFIGVTPTGATRVGGFVLESIARFVDSVVRGAPLLADARDGLANTRVLSAIDESAAGGRAVDIS